MVDNLQPMLKPTSAIWDSLFCWESEEQESLVRVNMPLLCFGFESLYYNTCDLCVCLFFITKVDDSTVEAELTLASQNIKHKGVVGIMLL